MASERQSASRAEHSVSTTSSGVSSVKRRSTPGVRNLALQTADASCTCEAHRGFTTAWQPTVAVWLQRMLPAPLPQIHENYSGPICGVNNIHSSVWSIAESYQHRHYLDGRGKAIQGFYILNVLH